MQEQRQAAQLDKIQAACIDALQTSVDLYRSGETSIHESTYQRHRADHLEKRLREALADLTRATIRCQDKERADEVASDSFQRHIFWLTLCAPCTLHVHATRRPAHAAQPFDIHVRYLALLQQIMEFKTLLHKSNDELQNVQLELARGDTRIRELEEQFKKEKDELMQRMAEKDNRIAELVADLTKARDTESNGPVNPAPRKSVEPSADSQHLHVDVALSHHPSLLHVEKSHVPHSFASRTSDHQSPDAGVGASVPKQDTTPGEALDNRRGDRAAQGQNSKQDLTNQVKHEASVPKQDTTPGEALDNRRGDRAAQGQNSKQDLHFRQHSNGNEPGASDKPEASGWSRSNLEQSFVPDVGSHSPSPAAPPRRSGSFRTSLSSTVSGETAGLFL